MQTSTFRTLALLALTLAAPTALAEEPIKIGAVLAVTGPAAFLGAPEAQTLQMLVDEANARGGVKGRKLQLIVKDTSASPEKAISFAKQLIEEEQRLRHHRPGDERRDHGHQGHRRGGRRRS